MEPPRLVKVSPDSGSTNVKPRAVVFQFDEVISETPRGGGAGVAGMGSNPAGGGASGLAGLVLVSPRNGAPDVGWHRDNISVRPSKGWKANTPYTVTLLPGVTDLRGNVRDSTTVEVFSTGPTIPHTAISGIVFDWIAARPVPRALVEAVAADSTTFMTLADSVGRFRFFALPPGPYLVRGVVDVNGNRGFEPREPYDSVRVTLRDSAAGLELLTFVHDTTGPRLQTVSVQDSVTLRVTLDRPLDPTQRVDTMLFLIRAQDSSVVPIRRVLTSAQADTERDARSKQKTDSMQRAADSARRARGDTARPPAPPAAPPAAPPVAPPAAPPVRRGAPRDTTPPPKPSRPSPVSEFVIELAQPLKPGMNYRVIGRNLRGLLGRVRTSDRVITVPKTPPPSPNTGPPEPPDRPRGGVTPPVKPPAADSSRAPRTSPPVRPPVRDTTKPPR